MILTNISGKRRMKNFIIVTMIIFSCLIIRIGWLQFVQGSELQSMAYAQQTLNRNINPKRGTIYDSTGENVLAISSTVETVTVNPLNIKKEDKEKTKDKPENKEGKEDREHDEPEGSNA